MEDNSLIPSFSEAVTTFVDIVLQEVGWFLVLYSLFSFRNSIEATNSLTTVCSLVSSKFSNSYHSVATWPWHCLLI